MNNKLRVGVLMGGKSIEKEVSFNSGRTICDHLDTTRYSIIPLFQRSDGSLYILPWRFLHRGKISDFEHRLETEAQKISWDYLKQLIDFMYIASHGRYSEDGALQGFLEILQIPYLGSKVFASALGMDKVMQKKILASNNITVPNGITVTPQDLEIYKADQNRLFSVLTENKLNFPLIVKPYREGSSLGISVVKDKNNLLKALINASTVDPKHQQTILIEEYISGMEFSCIIITDYKTGKPIVLPPTEIIPENNSSFFDYEQKYMPGRSTKFTPARCSPKIIEKIGQTCTRVMEILEIENLARIDGFVTKDETVVIIDPNTLSGMSPSSFIFRQAAELNMSHTQIINHLIETELHNNMKISDIMHEEIKDTVRQDEKKTRVAVILGGRTHEREISLESGRNVFYKLSPQKYEPIALFLDNNLELYKIDQSLLVRNSTKEIALSLEPHLKIQWSELPNIADFVFIGLHGGEGENGCVQGALEMLGLPYNGSSVLTSALCINKYKTNEYLKSQNFSVPENILIEQDSWKSDKESIIQQIEKKLSYPTIIKPHDDGCSVLVSKARNKIELIEATESIFCDGKKFALIEECVTGMELTVGVIGNHDIKALPPSQAVASQGVLSIEEKFLPGSGENQTPAPLPPATLDLVKRTMEQVFKALNCKGYARIDCFYQTAEQSPTKTERVVILEINTLPGMTPATCIFHQAAEIGIKPMDFVDLIIQLGFEEHKIYKTGMPKSTEQVVSLK